MVHLTTEEVVQQVTQVEQTHEDLQQAHQQLRIQLAEVTFDRDLKVQARQHA